MAKVIQHTDQSSLEIYEDGREAAATEGIAPDCCGLENPQQRSEWMRGFMDYRAEMGLV